MWVGAIVPIGAATTGDGTPTGAILTVPTGVGTPIGIHTGAIVPTIGITHTTTDTIIMVVTTTTADIILVEMAAVLATM